MARKLIFILLFILLTGSPVVIAQEIAGLTAQQKAWLSKAEKHEKAGWIYLHIEGSALERGFQHGYLLASEIDEALMQMRKVWYYQTAIDWSWLVKKGGEMFTPKVEAENIKEMEGMVMGMKAAGRTTTLDEMVTYNGSSELMDYWFPLVKDTISPNAPDPKKESCSSFIATGSMTKDGKIVLAHNTMSSFYYPSCNIVIDILPEKGHRILMQSAAGLIHSGTDFFETDAGIVCSETTIGAFFPFDEKGIPEFSRIRTASQYASGIDDFCEIMKKGNNGGYANAWLIGDIKTNEIARLELGLKYVGFEKKKDGFFTGSNIAEDIRILRFETKSSDTDIRNSNIARRVRWKQLMKQYKGKIDVQLAMEMEADHFDTYLNSETPGLRTLCSHPDLDPDIYGVDEPFAPWGTLDGKVVDADMAKNMAFSGRWGSACGTPFVAKEYLEKHPQYDWMEGIIKDRPAQPWTVFTSGEKK
jgi:hypothetical protein